MLLETGKKSFDDDFNSVYYNLIKELHMPYHTGKGSHSKGMKKKGKKKKKNKMKSKKR